MSCYGDYCDYDDPLYYAPPLDLEPPKHSRDWAFRERTPAQWADMSLLDLREQADTNSRASMGRGKYDHPMSRKDVLKNRAMQTVWKMHKVADTLARRDDAFRLLDLIDSNIIRTNRDICRHCGL